MIVILCVLYQKAKLHETRMDKLQFSHDDGHFIFRWKERSIFTFILYEQLYTGPILNKERMMGFVWR